MANSAHPMNWPAALAERGEFVSRTARTIAKLLAAPTITPVRLTSISQALDRYIHDFEAICARLEEETQDEFLLAAAKTIHNTLSTVRTAVSDRITEMQELANQQGARQARTAAIVASLLEKTGS